MTETLWTEEQVAFKRVHDAALAAVRSRYPGATEFRLVRIDGAPVGWTFHTGSYPKANFGWVTLDRTIGPPRHDIRMHARTALKKRGRS